MARRLKKIAETLFIIGCIVFIVPIAAIGAIFMVARDLKYRKMDK